MEQQNININNLLEFPPLGFSSGVKNIKGTRPQPSSQSSELQQSKQCKSSIIEVPPKSSESSVDKSPPLSSISRNLENIVESTSGLSLDESTNNSDVIGNEKVGKESNKTLRGSIEEKSCRIYCLSS